MPTLTNHYDGKTVLAVGAHPDDLELGLGGTIARLSKGGARVVMVIGCIPDKFDMRLEEAKKSAAILGAEVRVLLDEGPARVEDAKVYELVRRMDALMKEYKPTALFTH